MFAVCACLQIAVSPPPQRIIWCYGQWQPFYFDMMRTMPGIEFNQGIPDDIDNAYYLDVYKSAEFDRIG